MKLLKTTTVRFAAVIESCGAPQVYTLWQKPKEDRRLQAEVKKGHIMTVQKSESGTDFGCVGMIERKGALYLQFPKSLKRFADQRIVGIKWDLVQE